MALYTESRHPDGVNIYALRCKLRKCHGVCMGYFMAKAQHCTAPSSKKITYHIIIIVHYTTASRMNVLMKEAYGLQSTKNGTFALRDPKCWIWNLYSDSYPLPSQEERKPQNSCSLSILESLPWHQFNIHSEGLWAWPQWSCLWADDEKRRFKWWLGTLHFFSSINAHIKWQ